jgi:caffeoyl-CoA O-methyltransferase
MEMEVRTTMRRRSLFAVGLLALLVPAPLVWLDIGASGQDRVSAQTTETSHLEKEKRVMAVIDEMRRTGTTYLSVGERAGRMLRLMTEATGAKQVVEIGTSTGYSGLWFCLALQKSDGRLTTFEIDRDRAALAREHFKKAGVDHLVTIIEGNAHQTVTRLKDPIDIVFLDADKEGYVDYLNKLLPLVRPGGLILADNTNMTPAYVRAVENHPELETLYYTEGGARLGITLKKR